MKRNSSHHLPLLSLLGTLMLLNGYFVVGFAAHYDFFHRSYSSQNLLLYLYLNLIWIALVIMSGGLKDKPAQGLWAFLQPDILALGFYFISFLLFFQVFEIGYYYQREEVKWVLLLFAGSVILWKILAFNIYYAFRRKWMKDVRAVMVGYGENAAMLKKYLQEHPSENIHLAGIFDHRPLNDPLYLGDYDDMKKYFLEHETDEVFFSLSQIPSEYHDDIRSIINTVPVNIKFIPNLAGFSYLNTTLVNYDLIPVIEVTQGPLSQFYNRWIKRLFDMALSGFVILCVLSWLIPLLWFIYQITGQGSLFFIQKRSGLNNRTFSCIKFRTMVAHPDAEFMQASEQDPRVTALGKILRRTNVDELPQFINVLMNQMSVVGPRPHMLSHTERYKLMADKFMIRQTVKPGITGLAQVRGYRGEIRNHEDLTGRVRLDLFYMERWRLWLDVKIILLTLWNMIRGDRHAY